jgi:hypothetical protein
MSLICKQTLIGLCCASTLLELDESTIRKGGCGTEGLTLIRRGTGKRQRVSLILEEVIELRASWIEAERNKHRVVNKRTGTSKLQLVQ